MIVLWDRCDRHGFDKILQSEAIFPRYQGLILMVSSRKLVLLVFFNKVGKYHCLGQMLNLRETESSNKKREEKSQ